MQTKWTKNNGDTAARKMGRWVGLNETLLYALNYWTATLQWDSELLCERVGDQEHSQHSPNAANNNTFSVRRLLGVYHGLRFMHDVQSCIFKFSRKKLPLG